MNEDFPRSGMPPIHPGEFVREILKDLGISQVAFAKAIEVSPRCVSGVVREKQPVTADLALRFGRAFGQSPEFWTSWQSDYDLKLAEREIRQSLRKMRPLVA